LGLVAVVSIGAYATRQRWLGLLGLEPLPQERHLVVLPFESDAQDEKGRAFSDGLADTLTSRLGQMASRDGSLWVVPSDEVRRSGVTTAAAARRVFGVTLAVVGQLQHAGERLRLEAQVVDTRAEHTLRRLTLSTPVTQPADLEEQALSRLATLLDAEASVALKRPSAPPVPPNAYQMYTEGRGYLQRYEDPMKLDSAMSAFQRAVEIDPGYALAYAGMCEVIWRHYELTHEARLVADAQKACRRALELNDLLAQVHVTLGLLHVGTGRPEEAVADFDRALSLDPRNADAVLLRARPLAQLKRETEAEAEYRRAIALRPGYWAGYNLLARFFLDRGRYGEAEIEFQQALKLTPDNARLYYNLGGLYHKMGRTDDALRALDASLRLKPTPGALSNLGALYLAGGRYAEGASVFERAVAMTPSDYQLHYNLAWAYYWSPGMRDKARAEYEMALRLGEAQVHVNERDARLTAILADCWASIGDKVRAKELVVQALKLGKDNAEVHFRVAGTLEQLGDRVGALREVSQALDLRYSWEEVVRDPGFEALRRDPHFERLRSRTAK
jgi:eukaryotic-like serine/threonine-protein kinase